MTKLLAPLAGVVFLAACASTPPPAPATPAATTTAQPAAARVELENPANGTRIALKRGGELKLVLDANPTMTLQWQGSPSVGPVLAPIGQRVYVGKSVNVYDLTAGGWNIFAYRGQQAGRVTLQFDLRREGEPGPAVKTVRYEVTVE